MTQTTGRPLPEFAQALGEPGEHLARLKELVVSQGIALRYSEALGGAEGYSTGGTIVMKSGLAPAEEFSVLVHELAHEMLHRKEGPEERSKTLRETEAEAVAFVVCQAIGLDARASSTDYIHLYQGNKETLLASLGRVRQVAAEIIAGIADGDEPRTRAGQGEWESEGTGDPQVGHAA